MYLEIYLAHSKNLTSYINVGGVRTKNDNILSCLSVKLLGKQKSTNLSFLLYDCNYIHYQICNMDQFVHIMHIGFTQRHHDHLFKNSGAYDATCEA